MQTGYGTDFGLIPARAGSTVFQVRFHSVSRAHPRPCGEHCLATMPREVGEGSSPPVRGARVHLAHRPPEIGLIPARAGSTISSSSSIAGKVAHPRPCGEHPEPIMNFSVEKGSSPPVRGAHDRFPIHRHARGLIPARAGSTRVSSPRRPRVRAHPRPCGEHRNALGLNTERAGSSPPVRGALPHNKKLWDQLGLIPARAGSTYTKLTLCANRRAHPRPCGEHSSAILLFSSCLGSSPPVRGAQGEFMLTILAAGLIPARAGSTPRRGNRFAPAGAHPRPCGEHMTIPRPSRSTSGSSPPVRGAP